MIENSDIAHILKKYAIRWRVNDDETSQIRRMVDMHVHTYISGITKNPIERDNYLKEFEKMKVK